MARSIMILALLTMCACAPRQLYPTIPDMASDPATLNCKQLAREAQVAKDHMTTVQIRRASINGDDVAMFIGDFGATSLAAGSLAQQIAQERIDIISNHMVKKRCTNV